MTWITSPELVAADSNAGGLGILGFNVGVETGKATPEETAEEMRKVVRRTRELTEADGYLKWRCTPHKVAKEAIEENQKGNLKPSTGSGYRC